MTSTGSPRRAPPRGVKLISAWFTLLAVPNGLLGARAILILAFPAATPEWMGSDLILAPFGWGIRFAGEASVFFGVCVLHAAAAIGLWRLRGWARWLAIGLGAWGALIYLIRPSLQPSPVAFMFGALIIWYLLFANKAKQAFRTPLPEPAPEESIQGDLS